MKHHYINKEKNFIAGFYTDSDVIDTIQDFFDSVHPWPGEQSMDGNVDETVKKSLDRTLYGFLKGSYTNEVLYPALQEYLKLYEWANKTFIFDVIEEINVQKYNPGGGFYKYHFERSAPLLSYRHLVFMTYLNDVNDGGETEWFYQQTKIKPEKGLTVIWPTDWTHTHRGIPSMSETKTIVTGWLSYDQSKWEYINDKTSN